MAQGGIPSRHHHAVWEGGGSSCLVCVGALSRRGSGGSRLVGRRKPIDTFLKICEILNVPFLDIQHEWHFQGNANDKLPFCNGCLNVVQGIVDLQEQLESLQSKIIAGVEDVRCKIRESGGINVVPESDFVRVQNFRSRVLGSVQNPNILNGVTVRVPDASSSSSEQNQAFTTTPTSWPFAQHQQLYPQYSSQTTSVQHFNYTSATSPTTSIQETVTPPLAVVSVNYATSPDEFPPTISAKEEVPLVNSSRSSENFNTEGYYDDGDHADSYSSSGDGPSYQEDVHTSPSKRSQKSRSNTATATKSRARSIPTTPSKSKKLSTSFATSSSRDGGSRKSEYFAPVKTDASGKMLFEGISFTPNQPGGYQCGLCSAVCGKAHDSIALRKIKIHIKGVHLGAYKCPICTKNFTSNDILSQHISRTHEVGDKPCPNCGKPIRPRYMLLHQYTHMSPEEKAALVATGFKPPISNFDKERKIPCPKCGILFKKMTNLRIHERTHMDEKIRPKHKCETCGKNYSSTQSLKEHKQRTHPNPMNVVAELRRREPCEVCGKAVFSRVMARHMKTHIATENKPLACRICGKRFHDEKILSRHEERLHKKGESADQLPFSCEICGKRAATLTQIRSHRKRVHRNNLNAIIPPKFLGDISVDNPTDDFMLLEDLNREELQHVEGTMYTYHLYEVKKIKRSQKEGFQCCTCLKEILGEGDEAEEGVKEHIRQEHIGNYRCNLCTKRMKNLTEVIVHKRVEHQNLDSYDCTICKKPGIPRKSIKGHQYSHKSVREAAEAINEGYLMPASGMVNLTDRKLEDMEECLRSMGEELRYECVICTGEFTQLVELNRHRRQDHADKKKLSCKWEGQRKGIVKEDGRKTRFSKGAGNCPECGKYFDKGPRLARHLREMPCRSETKGKGQEGGKSRRGRKRKIVAEEKEEIYEVLSESEVKVEVESDEEEEKAVDESEEEESKEAEKDLVEDEDESDPEFRSPSKKNKGQGRRPSLRTRRAHRTVNYAEDEEEDDDDDEEEDCGKAQKATPIPVARRRGRPPRKRAPSLTSKVDPIKKAPKEKLLTEQEIKDSPPSSEAEDPADDSESGD